MHTIRSGEGNKSVESVDKGEGEGGRGGEK